jgi:hypothetical protein
MIRIAQEKWDTFYPDCMGCLSEHKDEVGADDGYPFDPDIDQAAAMSDHNISQIVTARAGNSLVGYCVFMISPSLVSRDVISGVMGPWYVRADYRGSTVTYRLFAESLRLMKERGVRSVYPHHWFKGDSPKAARLFEHFGAKPCELVYHLDLGA